MDLNKLRRGKENNGGNHTIYMESTEFLTTFQVITLLRASYFYTHLKVVPFEKKDAVIFPNGES